MITTTLVPTGDDFHAPGRSDQGKPRCRVSAISAGVVLMHRQIAGKLTGRVTKWLVLVAWIVILVAAAPFAAKLTDVQNNESSSWLPASAEATRALDKLGAFQSENAIPTAVVYEKDSGLTSQDLAAARQQAAQFQQLDGVEGKVVGPIPSADGKAAQTIVTFNFGKNGWNDMPDAAD